MTAIKESRLRIDTLDALRGLAAVTVVFSHVLVTLPTFWAVYVGGQVSDLSSIMGFTPLHLLWGGNEAVVLFFLLSGFVLSIPYWDGKRMPYAAFATRRVLRLYPAYCAAVATAMLALVALDAPSGSLSSWAKTYWNDPVTAPLLLDHVLMLASEKYNTVNPVIWSLAVEMQVSLLFPLLLVYMRMTRWAAVPVALGVSFTASQLLQAHVTNNLVLTSFLVTINYVWLFVLGAELARNRTKVAAWSERLTPSRQWTLIITGLLLLNVRWQPAGLPGSATRVLLAVGGALLLIAAAYFTQLRGFLNSRSLRWLGKVSYSLYLIHFVVLFTLLNLVPLTVALLLTVPLSFIAAEILHRCVEKPSIEASRNVGRRLSVSQSSLAAAALSGNRATLSAPDVNPVSSQPPSHPYDAAKDLHLAKHSAKDTT